MNGTYNSKKDGTTSEHFMKMAQLAKFLDPPIGPQELISLVAGHFTNDIRSTIIVSRPNSLKEVMQLLKDLKGNSGQNVGRPVESVEGRIARESNHRGGNQPFHRDGVRHSVINDRNNNINIEIHGVVTDNVGGRTDRSNNRWNQNERFRERRNYGMNHRVNFIGLKQDASRDRIPYWIRNKQRRGYWNHRQANRRRQERMVRENARGRFEERD